MRRRTSIKAAMLAGVMLSGLLVGVPPVVADEKVMCVSSKELGTNTPAVAVHGLNSRPNTWDQMLPVIKGIKDAYPVEPFNYEAVNREWVTNDKIGPALAKYIDCLSQASLKGGGKGKVIVVAHSMGGLATRHAVSLTVEGRKVADAILGMAAVAVPQLGSELARSCYVAGFTAECQGSAPKAMVPGSDQLRDLPRFPTSIPVRAIAGHVHVRARFGFGHIDHDFGGDLVVGVDSALEGHTTTGRGDGKHVVKCFGDNAINGRSHAPCEHGSMLNDDKVQQLVKEGIEQLIKGSRPEETPKPVLPAHTNVELFGKMTFPALATWGGGMSEPDVFGNFVDNKKCRASNAQCPHIYVENLQAGYFRDLYQGKPVEMIAARQCDLKTPSSQVIVKLKSKVKVAGEEANYYDQITCPTGLKSDTAAYIWHIPSKGVVVVAYDYGNQLDLDGVKTAVAHIIWK